MPRWFGLIFTLFPLIFIAVGTGLAINQHAKLVRYKPVTATIERTWIESRRGSESTNYAAKVDHRYEVEGQTYVGDHVYPLEVSSSNRSAAQRTINRFQVGDTVTAYYNPSDPSESFLVKEPDFFPYIFAMFPMLFVVIGLSILLAGPRPAKDDVAPRPAIEGFFELSPDAGLSRRLKAVVLVTGLWWLIGLVCLLHFTGIGGRMTMMPSIAMGVYGAVGLVGFGILGYYLKLQSQLHDALVMIDRTEPRIGDSLTVYVEQLIKKGLTVSAMNVGLRCEESYKRSTGRSTEYGTNVRHESSEPFECADGTSAESDRVVAAGEALRYTGTLTLPDNLPASTPARQKLYPRFRWFITVHTDILRGPDYKARFPLTVLPAKSVTQPAASSGESPDDKERPLVLEEPIRRTSL